MEFLYLYLCMQDKYNIVNKSLVNDLRITESEPSKMHNVRPYVYSRPWVGYGLEGVGERPERMNGRPARL